MQTDLERMFCVGVAGHTSAWCIRINELTDYIVLVAVPSDYSIVIEFLNTSLEFLNTSLVSKICGKVQVALNPSINVQL